MKLNLEVIKRIENIDWFIDCGEQNVNIDTTFSLRFVDSWKDAREHYQNPDWENITLEARNTLTSYLVNKHPQKFAEWNKLAREAKDIIETEIIPRILTKKEKINLDDILIDCIKWDLLHGIMESSYIKMNIKVPLFFIELLIVYEKGHLPCGMENNKTLIVY